MVIVISGWLISEGFLESNFNIKELPGGLSPSMEVLIEHIVQLEVWGKRRSNMVHVWRNIALFNDIAWPDLGNMHIDKQTIVSVNFIKFILGELSRVNVILNVAMLVR